MTFKLRTALLLIGLVGLSCAPSTETPDGLSRTAGWKGAEPKSPDAFTFVVMSDRTSGHVSGQLAVAVEKMNLLRPDFVISVGDLIEGYNEDRKQLASEWQEFDALVHKLKAPFFYCAGNHDVSNDVMLDEYVSRHGVSGKSYYSFNYRGCHFVVLNSNSAFHKAGHADEQIKWLADDIGEAPEARHVFVFYHHPLFEDTKLWPRLSKLLPVGKTTIFNGHWHGLNYKNAGGIPTYVLGATAAEVHEPDFRMFAHVSVDAGTPDVALLPIHEIYTLEYAQDATLLNDLARTTSMGMLYRSGGSLVWRQGNPLDVPVMATLGWETAGWTISPASATLTIDPGAEKTTVFKCDPPTGPANPTRTITYAFKNASGKERALSLSRALKVRADISVPRTSGIAVDGKLDDWKGIGPMHSADESCVYRGRSIHSGNGDSSFSLRAATDGALLYVAVEVTDDQIVLGGKFPWLNDAVEFFWDARPPEKRNGKHGQGTGQLIVVVPE